MLLRFLLALSLAAMLGMAHAAPSARDFDRLFLAIDDGEREVLNAPQATAALAELRALLPPGDAARARRYRTAVCQLAFLNQSDAGAAYARAGLEEARRAGDVDAQARFGTCLGFALEARDTGAARQAYDAALRAALRAEDPRLIGDGYTYRGGIYSLQGQQALALQDFLTAQTVYERAGLARRAESNLLNIGVAYRRMGLHAEALRYLRQLEAHARRLHSQPELLSTLLQQGFAYEELGRPTAAIRAFGEALSLARRSGALDEGYARLGLADAWRAAGNARRALQLLAQARRDLAVDRVGENEPMLDQVEGEALAQLGRHAAALAAFDRAEPLMRAQGNLRYLAMLHAARARSREALGDAAGALADLRAHAAERERLREDADDQRVSLWRLRFEASRRALERARLDLEQRRREHEIRALEHERSWRGLVIALGAVLVAALAGYALLQRRQARRLRLLALTDVLTGLANRRHILRLAAQALDEGRAAGAATSVVAIDLDHFKQVNDAHGHAVGDAVLARLAAVLTAALRRQDRLGRSGGEEFLVVLPGTPARDARAVAERLRQAAAAFDAGRLAPGLAVRISAGVATARAGEPLDALLARADAALYRAKAQGRDCVVADD